MKNILTTILIASFLFVQTATGYANKNNFDAQSATSISTSNQVEPNAGNWRTWVISSGRDYRVPLPLDPAKAHGANAG